MTPQVEFHIERLIVDGLGVKASERSGLQEAVVQELTRLLGGLEVGAVQAGTSRSLQVHERVAGAESLGTRIALGAVQALTPQEGSR